MQATSEAPLPPDPYARAHNDNDDASSSSSSSSSSLCDGDAYDADAVWALCTMPVLRRMFVARDYTHVRAGDHGEQVVSAMDAHGGVVARRVAPGFEALRRVLRRERALDPRARLVAVLPLHAAAAPLPPELVHDGRVELWPEHELLLHVEAHARVPPHRRATARELAALRARHGANVLACLPRIEQRDPQARFLALRRGEVVRVARHDHVRGAHAYYRVCV